MRPLGVRFFSSWEVWKKKCRIWMLDNKSCHPATFFLGKSSYFFKSSNGYNILHLNINGLKMSNLTNFITPFPFLESILCCNHFLWWTIWYDRFLKKILFLVSTFSWLHHFGFLAGSLKSAGLAFSNLKLVTLALSGF